MDYGSNTCLVYLGHKWSTFTIQLQIKTNIFLQIRPLINFGIKLDGPGLILIISYYIIFPTNDETNAFRPEIWRALLC